MNEEPYGYSKKVIRESVLNNDNFYNLRVFGVFDENELDTRFIKSNIKRYINRESIIVHQDKLMDFIYMPDLVDVVECYINNDGPKELECAYDAIFSLKAIANMINSLDNYKVDIEIINKEPGKSYVGRNARIEDIKDKFIGLSKGIREVYIKLKK